MNNEFETNLQYEMIYQLPDGRLCAVDVTENGCTYNAAGEVRVGLLLDGQLMSYDDTEWVWALPGDLVPYQDLVPIVDPEEGLDALRGQWRKN